jgi:uncharacterized protein (TIGR02246 family)
MLSLGVCAAVTLVAAQAQEGKPPPEDPAHEELRTLRREMVEAVNKNDLDALLSHLDKNVVVTWMDGRVSRGPQGVREYIEKMTKGESRKVDSHSTEAEVDELTHLFGNTGVATGHSRDRFVLTDGRDFTVDTRWTATVVKSEGKWKVAGFHSSTDVFDNPILHIAVRRTAVWTAIIGGLAGVALGFVAAGLLRRHKPGGQASPHP